MTHTITKLSCMTLLFAAIGINSVQAGTPCDGFKINLKNNLPYDLLVSEMHILGAQIEPSGIQKIDRRTEASFTVNQSLVDAEMPVTITLRTPGPDSKYVTLKFNLTNNNVICEHTKRSDNEGSLNATSERLFNKISYSIN